MKNINIFKAILFTILYKLFIEIIGFWIFLEKFIGENFVNKYYALINGLIEVPLIILFIKKIKGTEENILKKTQIKWYYIAIILGLLYPYIQIPLNTFFQFITNENHTKTIQLEEIRKIINLNLIPTILLIPICEELFFREFIQNGLHKKLNPTLSIAITSILFASIHLSFLNFFFSEIKFSFHHAYIALFGGIITGVIYFKSKSIGPSIIYHISWNLMVSLI